jgi:hypothetical protein
MGILKLNGITLPSRNIQYTQGWIDFEVKDRTINKTLVSDFIAIKRVFSISWPVLEGSFMAQLINIYLAKNDVTFEEQQPNGSFLSFTCRMAISESVLREIDIENYAFSGFSFRLEEV